ncbi:hypothetical protein BV898_07497 [Hypsibius exemplaris]|uniref:Uncharacterized protein n=1 Tax=Hypsibius exemplaris TaxID=2072580 RepID=A0A1W0WTE9_HYPEX|nr:hypothetical protein BV898_07497 [Hypsibius exemplaris]
MTVVDGSASPVTPPLPHVAATGEEAERRANRPAADGRQPVKLSVQGILLLALRYLGIGLLLTTQVSLGIGYIFLLSAVEFFLILIYAAAHLSRYCGRKISLFSLAKTHTS